VVCLSKKKRFGRGAAASSLSLEKRRDAGCVRRGVVGWCRRGGLLRSAAWRLFSRRLVASVEFRFFARELLRTTSTTKKSKKRPKKAKHNKWLVRLGGAKIIAFFLVALSSVKNDAPRQHHRFHHHPR